MDFIGILSALDPTSILAALAAVAVLLTAVNVARWGYDQVIGWLSPSNGFTETVHENGDISREWSGGSSYYFASEDAVYLDLAPEPDDEEEL